MPSHAIAHFMAFCCCFLFFLSTQRALLQNLEFRPFTAWFINCQRGTDQCSVWLPSILPSEWKLLFLYLSICIHNFLCVHSLFAFSNLFTSLGRQPLFSIIISNFLPHSILTVHKHTPSCRQHPQKRLQATSVAEQQSKQTDSTLERREKTPHGLSYPPCCYLDQNFFLEKTSPAPLLSIQQLPTLRRELCNSFL